MYRERRSVKQRIFRSNTVMVIVTLSLFLVVNLFVIKLYEKSFKASMIGSYELSAETQEIESILTKWNASLEKETLKKLDLQLGQYGYELCVQANDAVIYSNINFKAEELSHAMGQVMITDNRVHIYLIDGITVLAKFDEKEKMMLYAIAGEDPEHRLENINFTGLLLLLLIDGIFCIGVLFVISRIFTKRLIKYITNPLDALYEGAKRMKEGDFSEQVHYQGDVEFEYVCDSFNQMQERITEVLEEKEAYERARIDMVAGISHDLRTPLTAIRGTIKGLLDGIAATPELQERFLDTAYKRTLEMDRLLERLFYFSKLETGNMPLLFEKTEWKEYLEAYVKNYEILTEKDNFRLSLGAITQGTYSDIDRGQMKRILDNLVENCKKYAEADPLEVVIHTLEDPLYLVIEVSDNGKGVTEEMLSHIFDQFYRGDESRNKKEGSGLGLYIVRYLVEAMGGTVKAFNRNGLTVQISLPRSREGEKLDG